MLLLYLYLSFIVLSNSIYLFYLVFVLSFDVCIVTITWARLCIVISSWVICPTYLQLFLLGLIEDREIEVRVSFYKL
jgi:hypothetical protein